MVKGKRLIQKVSRILLAVIIATATMFLPMKAAYADDKFYVIDEEFFMNVFTLPPTSHGAFLDDYDYLKTNATILANPDAGKVYSLYDRFGANISFFDYHGEFNADVGAKDQIFTWMVNGDTSFSIQKLIDLFNGPPAHKTPTDTYNGRTEVENSFKDPRYAIKSSRGTVDFSGQFATHYGNYLFETTVKYPLLTTGALLDDGLSIKILDMMCDDQSILKIFIDSTKDVVLLIGVLGFMVRIVSLFIQYSKGRAGMKELGKNFGGFLLAMLIIAMLVAQPTFPAKIAKSMVTATNSLINAGSSTLNTSPISEGSDSSHISTAIIWDHAVMRPWMKANLGLSSYDEGNITTGSAPSNTSWPVENDIKISVPRGGSKYESNIAAMWYSIMNDYHIELDADARKQQLEASSDSKKSASSKSIEQQITDQTFKWPFAEKAKSFLYVDSFRVIDTMLNVNGDKGMLKMFNPHPILGANHIIIVCLVTICGLFIWGWRKLLIVVQLAYATFNLFFIAFLALFKGDRSVIPPLQAIWEAFKAYISLSLYLVLVMAVYAVTIDTGFLGWIMFILFSLAAYRHSKNFVKAENIEGAVKKLGSGIKSMTGRMRNRMRRKG